MRRSNFVTKLVSLVIFIAIVSYIGFYIYNSVANPFQTALAANLTVEVSSEVTGFVVRNETVLSGDGSNVSITASEGTKLAVGQEIAVEYSSATALQQATEIHELELQIEQIESFLESGSSVNFSETTDRLFALSYAVAHKDFTNLDELSLEIETSIFSGGNQYSTENAELQLAELESQLSSLQTSLDSDISKIYATSSGLFSSVVDGKESISPENLVDLSPQELSDLFTAQNAAEEYALGKLVYGITWYYAAVMDYNDAKKLTVGKSATLQFTKTYSNDLSMIVESIGADSNGKCVVVFSCTSAISDIVSMRELTADIIFETYTGIRVPKEAVRLDEEGHTCIYLLTGLQAEIVQVNILYESDDYYIVESGSVSGSALRAGSEIIVKANDLYNGKVVQ